MSLDHGDRARPADVESGELRPTSAQATVAAFDAETGVGSVLLDDGLRLPFGARAFARSGLRSLRLGQRVRLEIAGRGDAQVVTALTVVTLPMRE